MSIFSGFRAGHHYTAQEIPGGGVRIIVDGVNEVIVMATDNGPPAVVSQPVPAALAA